MNRFSQPRPTIIAAINALLLALVAATSNAATIYCTNLVDALGVKSGVQRVTFTPTNQVPQSYGNQTVLPKVVAANCDSNSAFSATIIAGGFYWVTFTPPNSYVPPVGIIVPSNDTNSYNLNQAIAFAGNKNWFVWTNTYAGLLPGNNVSFRTTTNGTTYIDASGAGGGGSGTATNLSGGALVQVTNITQSVANTTSNAIVAQIPSTNGFVTQTITNGLATTNFVQSYADTNGAATNLQYQLQTGSVTVANATYATAAGSAASYAGNLSWQQITNQPSIISTNATSGQLSFYVSPNGSDTNSGTSQFYPLATMWQAITLASNAPKPCRIVLMAGDHTNDLANPRYLRMPPKVNLDCYGVLWLTNFAGQVVGGANFRPASDSTINNLNINYLDSNFSTAGAFGIYNYPGSDDVDVTNCVVNNLRIVTPTQGIHFEKNNQGHTVQIVFNNPYVLAAGNCYQQKTVSGGIYDIQLNNPTFIATNWPNRSQNNNPIRVFALGDTGKLVVSGGQSTYCDSTATNIAAYFAYFQVGSVNNISFLGHTIDSRNATNQSASCDINGISGTVQWAGLVKLDSSNLTIGTRTNTYSLLTSGADGSSLTNLNATNLVGNVNLTNTFGILPMGSLSASTATSNYVLTTTGTTMVWTNNLIGVNTTGSAGSATTAISATSAQSSTYSTFAQSATNYLGTSLTISNITLNPAGSTVNGLSATNSVLYSTPVTLAYTGGTNVLLDLSTGMKFQLSLTNNAYITLTNALYGMLDQSLSVTNTAANFTVTWNTNQAVFCGGVQPYSTTNLGAMDTWTMRVTPSKRVAIVLTPNLQ